MGEEVEDREVLPEHLFLPQEVREGIGTKIQVKMCHFHRDKPQALPHQGTKNPGRESTRLCSSGVWDNEGGGFSFHVPLLAQYSPLDTNKEMGKEQKISL